MLVFGFGNLSGLLEYLSCLHCEDNILNKKSGRPLLRFLFLLAAC